MRHRTGLALLVPLLGAILVSIARSEEAKPKKMDLNAATVKELAELPDIGPAIARRIVEHREKNGPFRKVEELLIIRGINRKKFAKIRPLVFVETKPPRRVVGAKERKPG